MTTRIVIQPSEGTPKQFVAKVQSWANEVLEKKGPSAAPTVISIILRNLKSNLLGNSFCVLAITMDNLYPDPRWNFVFGPASLQDRVGVFSLKGIMISVNPFYAEYVPFERTDRCVRISQEVFGQNVMVYINWNIISFSKNWV